MSAARKHREELDADVVAPVVAGNPEGTEYVTRGARGHKSARPHLRMVSPLRPERASRGVFAIVVTATLAIGMLAILLINTSLAQGAFTVSELKAEQTALVQQEQALAEEVAALATPEMLEGKAREMGMVPSENPVFLDVQTGKVLGKPKPAPGTRATMPRLLTPADATAAEGVDNALAGLPVAADPNLDPAAVDAAALQAAANELTGEAAAKAEKKAKNPLAESNLWEDAVILDVTDELGSGDAGLVAVPVP
ncbi:MAG TPA: hypothetical protein DCQ36_07330 [Actinobacteria bacterium]|jgi:hypothetical protein|nr:hypothetical protein [Actinomycetota bacterium]